MDHTTYPRWVIDDSEIEDEHGRGESAVRFIKKLHNSYSNGREMGLPRFWERIIRGIYGPSDANGDRLIRSVFIMIPRGARKSTIAGALGLYHTLGKDVRRKKGQIIVAASAKKQAFHVFGEARDMALSTPWITLPEGQGPEIVRIRGSAKQAAEDPYIEHIADGTTMIVASADGDSAHGGTPSVAIFDELHVFKNDKLYSAIQSGMVKIPGTLSIVITTAGRGQSGVAWDEYCYAKAVAKGEIVNPRYLPILFEPPSMEADWTDRNLWDIVNPGLREGFPDIVGFEDAAQKALDSESKKDEFKQLNLNFWLAQSTSPFVPMSVYDLGDTEVDLQAHEDFRDPCWMAVDLGISRDLSAVVLCWRDPSVESGYEVAAWFFCPDDNIDERSDGDHFDYRKWASHKNRYMIPTPGNITDYNLIQQHIEDLRVRFNVQEIAFDPAYGGQIMSNLTDAGHPVVQMQQGWRTMSPAIAELERSLTAKRFSHGGNPVLRWNFENVTVHTDSAGNRTFHKGKSTDRIDGSVATVMAVARAFANAAPEAAPIPFYLQPGFSLEQALGLPTDGATPADAAENAGRQADIDAQVRKMLGIE